MFGKAIPNLPARDLDATAAMFTRIGFTETHRYDGYSIIERDEVELHYYAKPDHDPGKTAGMSYIRVSDVNALYAEVTAAGFEILSAQAQRERSEQHAPLERITALEDKPWGLRQFALLDIDGNLFHIGQPLNSPPT
jgi:catechol 2,3-dioxygenase-like lactoylglutathione lyase family enzyme